MWWVALMHQLEVGQLFDLTVYHSLFQQVLRNLLGLIGYHTAFQSNMQSNGVDDVSISISEEIGGLSPSPSMCSIFRVHNQLRLVNEKAYEPQIISIGPYHRGKDTLQMMEKHKLRYLQRLLKRKKRTIEEFVSAMRSREQEARMYYAEPVRLNENELIKMLILDGCFIIELLLKCWDPSLIETDDLIFKMDWMVISLQRDLMLFENQLPFIVLSKLFEVIEAPNQDDRLVSLALHFFRDLSPGQGYRPSTNGDIKHLLGLIHSNWLPLFSEDPAKNEEKWQFIHCATELQEAGVKFHRLKKVENALHMAVEPSLFGIKFENGVIHIPPLIIEDRTETFFRNLIAYEQYGSDNCLNHITDYVKFMDCLIDTAKDVEILCRYKIIDNWLGDNEAVSTIFKKICDSVTGPNDQFRYVDICNRVNIHCNKRKNRWISKLRRNLLLHKL